VRGRALRRLRERLGFGVLAVAGFAVIGLAVALFGLIAAQGAGSLSLELIFSPPRKGMTEGGIFPAILGTFLVTLTTAIAAIPLGVAAAIYLALYARPGVWTSVVRTSIRNLAGVPSIVYGLFGLALFVHGLGFGHSILASGLTLGLLTLPAVVTSAEEAIGTVPVEQKDGALALGATKWEAIRTVILPAAGPGILTGAILGLSRAAGETAPILVTGVTFSRPSLPASPLDEFMALPFHLYVLATQHHDPVRVRPLAYATALVLLVLVALMSGGAAIVRARLSRARAS
jgi:phosphate transport system permease protein